jgi:hypothetical protein
MGASTVRRLALGPILAFAGALAASSAAAAEPPSLADAQGFVVSHGAPSPIGQLARWDDGVCPEATGIPADIAGYVASRIREVAAAVHAPVAGKSCTTNIQIIFTNTPQQVVDQIAKNQGQLLGYYGSGGAKVVRTVTRPIQAWYLTATENDRHQATLDMPTITSGNVATERGGYGLAPGGYTPSTASAESQGGRPQVGGVTTETCLGGKFSRCMTSVFAHVLIVVDGKALYGRQIGPLVDYVALLALSQPADYEACGSLPSVLDLFSKACANPAPEALTPTDLAYLSALYRTDLATALNFERTDIAALMTRTAPAQKSP